jgi:hypothetical protein
MLLHDVNSYHIGNEYAVDDEYDDISDKFITNMYVYTYNNLYNIVLDSRRYYVGIHLYAAYTRLDGRMRHRYESINFIDTREHRYLRGKRRLEFLGGDYRDDYFDYLITEHIKTDWYYLYIRAIFRLNHILYAKQLKNYGSCFHETTGWLRYRISFYNILRNHGIGYKPFDSMAKYYATYNSIMLLVDENELDGHGRDVNVFGGAEMLTYVENGDFVNYFYSCITEGGVVDRELLMEL